MDNREWEEWLDGLADLGETPPADAPDLTAAILARTSGPACGRAGALLASLPDGAPELGDAQLLHGHLDGCADCRALADALAWLGPELRAMAEVAPDADFVADVLVATAPLRAKAAARAARRAAPRRLDRAFAPVEALAGRAGAWWRQQVRRPRFAFEFAYVATMLLLVLCATPVSPLRGAPERALAVVKASPSGLATAASWVWNALPDRVTLAGEAAWGRTGGRVGASVEAASARCESRVRRVAPQRDEAARRLAETGRALVHFDFVTAAARWSSARAALADLWRAWFTDEAATAPASAGDPRSRA